MSNCTLPTGAHTDFASRTEIGRHDFRKDSLGRCAQNDKKNRNGGEEGKVAVRRGRDAFFHMGVTGVTDGKSFPHHCG
jgi:hypothetical protein